MKHIQVAAAVIIDGRGCILSTQRGYGEMRGGWEFPGGKIEVGETAEQALHREIREELGIEIVVGELLTVVEWDYPTFHLTMHCFECRLVDGEPELREHLSMRWLSRSELLTVDWLPADIGVVELLMRNTKG